MTLAVGWIRNGNAFLVADSIASRNRAPENPETTSMGEEPPAELDTIESSVKVYELAPQLVGTISGDARDGISAMATLRNRMRASRDLESELMQLSGETFDAIVGQATDSRASLYVRRGGRWMERYEETDVEILGSAHEFHAKAARSAVLDLAAAEGIAHDADHVLVNVLVHLRAQVVRDPQRARGIGGAFYGMRVSRSGVVRHRDVLFVLVDRTKLPTLEGSRWTLVGWRNELAFSMAIAPDRDGKTGRHVRFHASDVNPATREFAEDVLRDLETQRLRPPYLAFVDINTGAPIVLAQDAFGGQFASIDVVGNEIDIGYSDLLLSLLERLPTLEQMLQTKVCPHHFVATEADAQKLVRNGWLEVKASGRI